jgi:FAD/FMN-containing dehydrogenase
MGLMRSIKRALDPKGLMNPGKVLDVIARAGCGEEQI